MMKKAYLSIFLLPILALTSCNKGTKVHYEQYIDNAYLAMSRLEKTPIEKASFDLEGRTTLDGVEYKVSMHEDYTVEGDRYILDKTTEKYEPSLMIIVAACGNELETAMNTLAMDIKESSNYIYTINPLSVTKEHEKFVFDEYGMPSTYTLENEKTNIKLRCKYVYK